MKKALVTFLFAAAAAMPCSANAINVLAPHTVNIGDTFAVTIDIGDNFGGRPADTLIAFGFNFIYDPSVISLVGITLDSTNWVDVSNPGGTPPQVAGFSLTGLTFDSTAAPLVLATLRLHALASGSTDFSITTSPGDLNTGLIFLEDPPYTEFDASGTIDIPAAAVPEPATLLLFVTMVGCIGVAVSRRRVRAARVNADPLGF